MITRCKISKDDEANKEDQKLYILMIESMLYVTASRPDIMHVVGLVARFQASPEETHVQAVKIIFRYLKGTFDFGLWYPPNGELILEAYKDADCAGSIDNQKIISGVSLFLGKCLIS